MDESFPIGCTTSHEEEEETGQSDGQTAENSLTSCANCVAELTTRDNATLDRGVIGEPRQISRETGPEEFRGSAERGKRGGEKKTRRPFYCRSRPTPPPFSICRKFTDQREFPRSSIYNETSNGFMIGIIIVADKVERFHGSVEIYLFGEAKYRGERRVFRDDKMIFSTRDIVKRSCTVRGKNFKPSP